MSSMRILVTGGAGFVGSSLAISLREQIASEVVVMDNLYRRGSELNLPRLKKGGVFFHYGDVREIDSFPKGPFDILVDCSAEPSVLSGLFDSPQYLYQTNLTGAFHSLEQARQWGAGFVFLSTSRVYPIEQLVSHSWREEQTRFSWLDTDSVSISSRGVTEDLPMSGARSLYGWTKYAAEQLIEEYRFAFGLKALVNRCGMIAGPWQFGKVDQGIVSYWVQAHLFGWPLRYLGYGNVGKQVRDVLHVDDLIDLVLEQVGNFSDWDGWVGNVSGGIKNSTSLLELTQTCVKIIGRETLFETSDEMRPADLRIFVADCERLEQRMNWGPRRDLHQIVRDICDWAIQNESRLKSLRC